MVSRHDRTSHEGALENVGLGDEEAEEEGHGDEGEVGGEEGELGLGHVENDHLGLWKREKE